MIRVMVLRFYKSLVVPVLAGLSCFLTAHAGVFDAGRQVIDEVFGKPFRSSPELTQYDASEAFDTFRKQRIYGGYSFIFELHNMPRRSRGSLYYGIIFGDWGAEGPIARVELKSATNPELRHDLLAHSGTNPRVWIRDSAVPEGYRELTREEIFKPIFPDLEYSPFELFFNYLYWENPTYLGPIMIKSRPAQIFHLTAPAWVGKLPEQYSGVNVYIDSDYKALIQADLLDQHNHVEKTVKVLNFKKVQDQWIVKTIDLVNEYTKDKTRFDIKKAALNLRVNPESFTPEWLTAPMPRVEDRVYTFIP